MVKRNLITFFALLLLLFSGTTNAQISVTNGGTPASIASTLGGPGVIIFNETISGAANSYGTFTGGTVGGLGITSGVILSTGVADTAKGPNLSTFDGDDLLQPGDPDLNVLAGSFMGTFDACILEFDFVAACDTVQIAYVFGSEEYPEFVGAGFNDVFAFWISGPGYTTPTNIALIPGTTIPVAIDNVNPTSFPAYYVDNFGGTEIEYDGHTTPLLAKAWVSPCDTYHVKLAIADDGDGSYDSGVFLEEGGIRCFSSIIDLSTSTTNPSSSDAVEGCVDGVVTFSRLGDISVPDTITYTIAGTATNGVDYAPLSGEVAFPVGVASVNVTISAFQDGIPEGTESVMLIVADTVCSVINADTALLLIQEPPEVEAGPDLSLCGGETGTLGDPSNPATATFLWTPATGLSSDTDPMPTVTLPTPGTYIYYVQMTDDLGCISIDSATVVIVEPPSTPFTTMSPICIVDSSIVQYTGTAGPSAVYDWSFDGGVIITGGTGPGPHAIAWTTPGTKYVTLQITEGPCVSQLDTQIVEVVEMPSVDLGPDTLACDGDLIIFDAGNPGANYDWSSGHTTQTIKPTTTGTYTVTVNFMNLCFDSDDKFIEFKEVPDVELGPNVSMCEGQSVVLDAGFAGSGYTYFWSNGTREQTTEVWNGGLYTVNVTNDFCTGTDRVRVTKNPLPRFWFTEQEACFRGGEVVTLEGPAGPGMVYNWSTGSTDKDLVVTQAGIYSLHVVDEYGCEFTQSVEVTSNCKTRLFIPSAFSPNNDGLNDEFLAQGYLIEDFSMDVFDRWGKLIFQSQTITSGWDGTINGSPAPEGVYTYRVNYSAYFGEKLFKEVKAGTVTLIR